MAIYTPRGLKIRLPIDTAFALIARLHPRVDAFAVLKTTEALESVPAAAALIVGTACFAFNLAPLLTGVAVAVTVLVTSILDRRIWLAVAPLLFPARLYSYVSGFGILELAIGLFGYWRSGWAGVIAFFGGRISGSILNYIPEFQWSRRVQAKTGVVITASERHFYNAYRWHALRTGASADVNVTDEERTPSRWQHSLVLLELKWPAVTRRFTNDDAPAA